MLTTFRMDPSRPLKSEALRASLEPGVPWLDAKGRSSEALQMLEGRVRRLAVRRVPGLGGWHVLMDLAPGMFRYSWI